MISEAEKFATKQEAYGLAKDLLKGLMPRACLEAIRLEKMGIAIDDDLRLKPLYDPSDKRYVDWKKKEFKVNQDKSAAVGELLELSEALASKELLGNRFLVVRTSEFDDFRNGVDEIIFDEKTGTIVGAVDATSDPKSKATALMQKPEKLREGVSLKYGLAIEGGVFRIKPVSGLPLFTIYVPRSEVIDLAKSIKGNDVRTTRKFSAITRDSLANQCTTLSEIAKSSQLIAKLQDFRKAL